MMHDITKDILNSIEEDWKSIPQIAKELDINIMRVHNQMKYFEKVNMVMCSYGEKEKSVTGRTPKVFKRR